MYLKKSFIRLYLQAKATNGTKFQVDTLFRQQVMDYQVETWPV